MNKHDPYAINFNAGCGIADIIKPSLVLVGAPFEEQALYGPFPDHDAAAAWADRVADGYSYVATLHPATGEPFNARVYTHIALPQVCPVEEHSIWEESRLVVGFTKTDQPMLVRLRMDCDEVAENLGKQMYWHEAGRDGYNHPFETITSWIDIPGL